MYVFVSCHWLRYSNIRIIVLIVLWKAKFQMISLSRFLTYRSAQMLNLVRWNAWVVSHDRFNRIRITIFQELHADLWKWTFKNRFKKKTSSDPKWMNGTFNWEKWRRNFPNRILLCIHTRMSGCVPFCHKRYDRSTEIYIFTFTQITFFFLFQIRITNNKSRQYYDYDYFLLF